MLKFDKLERYPEYDTTDKVHDDLLDIFRVINGDLSVPPSGTELKVFSYEGEKKSGDGDVTIFDDKYLGTAMTNDGGRTYLETLIAGLKPDREIALCSTLRSGHFLPVLDLDVPDAESFIHRIDDKGSGAPRVLLRHMQPMIFDSGNSLHLYGGVIESPARFAKFCGEALLAFSRPPCDVLDVRWLGHSLARGEFHFRVSHKSGFKVKCPERDKVTEAKMVLSLSRWESHDRHYENSAYRSKISSLS